MDPTPPSESPNPRSAHLDELSTIDLRKCELAFLSACDTNAGLRASGQGIHSLQTALHAVVPFELVKKSVFFGWRAPQFHATGPGGDSLLHGPSDELSVQSGGPLLSQRRD